MCIKSVKIIPITWLIVVLFHQVLCLHGLSYKTRKNVPKISRSLDVTNECTTPTAENGFCVPAQNCNWNYVELNETFIDQISCGPRNQNRNTPQVCCQLNRIMQDNTIYENTTPSFNQDNYSNNINNKILEAMGPSSSSSVPICGTQILSRIVGGEDALPGEFPWMARLMRVNTKNQSIFSCTGVLISTKVVLTTAHCIVSPDLVAVGELDTVHLGELETECKFGQSNCLDNKKSVKVARAISHPKYTFTRSHRNDVAIVILAEKVKITPFISPICLLEEPYEAFFYVVSGWGKTETGGISVTKLKTTLMPYSWHQCVQKYKTVNITLTTKQICAGGFIGRDSCQGDSGGPLMILKNDTQWFAAGLVSFGVGCGKEGWPGVYASVPSYIKWIKNEMVKAGA